MSINQRRAGALLSYVSIGVSAGVSFLYVPILLGSLTVGEYGVYELIGSVIAYLSIADLGLSTTLNRFYSYMRASENAEKVENLLAISIIVYLLLTALALGASLAVNASLDSMFGRSLESEELQLAHEMMVLVTANCIILFPSNWLIEVINSHERFVFSKCVNIVKYPLQALVIVFVLQWHSSAFMVLLVQVAANYIAAIICACYVVKRIGIKVHFHHWEWPLVSSLISFSFFTFVNMLCDQIFWKAGQVILGITVGSVAVAVYGVCCKVITMAYMQISTGVASVFLPKLSVIAANTSDMTEVNEIFCKVGRIQAMLVWGCLAAFVVVGREFIALWAGPEFLSAYPAIVVLMLGLSVALIENLGLCVLQAKNKLKFRSCMYLILALLDILISVPVSKEYGVMGCSVVTAVLLFIGTGPIMNCYYKFRIGIDVGLLLRRSLPLIIPAGVACFAVAFVGSIAFPAYSAFGLLVKILLFCVVDFVLSWLFFMDDYEKSLVTSVLRGKI